MLSLCYVPSGIDVAKYRTRTVSRHSIPYRTYETIFQDELGQILLQNEWPRLLVFDEFEEVFIETSVFTKQVNRLLSDEEYQ